MKEVFCPTTDAYSGQSVANQPNIRRTIVKNCSRGATALVVAAGLSACASGGSDNLSNPRTIFDPAPDSSAEEVTEVTADNFEDVTGTTLVNAFNNQYADGSSGDCFTDTPLDPVRSDSGQEAIVQRYDNGSSIYLLTPGYGTNRPIFNVAPDGTLEPENPTAQHLVQDYGCE